MKSFITAISLSILLNKTNAYLLLPGIDFYGGDMYPVYDVNSTMNCLSLCESVRNCRLATWCDNVCYLKDIKTNKTEKIDCITIDMYPYEEIINENSMESDNETITAPPVATLSISIDTPEPSIEDETSIPNSNTSESSSYANNIKNIYISISVALISTFFYL
jgi:hypothetical protein